MFFIPSGYVFMIILKSDGVKVFFEKYLLIVGDFGQMLGYLVIMDNLTVNHVNPVLSEK